VGDSPQSLVPSLKVFFLSFVPRYVSQANQIKLEWEEAVDLVHDALGVMVHQQVVDITENIGVVVNSFPVCLFLELQVKISGA
jgi:hypothetical protein